MKIFSFLALLAFTTCVLAENDAIVSVFRPYKPKTFVIDLDKAPKERFNEVLHHYKAQAPEFTKYYREQVKVLPEFVVKILQSIAGNLALWPTLPEDQREEFRSISEIWEIPMGEVVILNFLYELRWFGPPANSTGPLPPHLTEADLDALPRGACTSVVATNTKNATWHTRNLDWNLPNALRNMTYHCEFHKGGKLKYHGACFPGFTGQMTSLVPGQYGVTINERKFGGNVIVDALEAIVLGGWSPSHLLRHVLETADTFDEAHKMLATFRLSAPAYYTMSNAAGGGKVLQRSRNSNDERSIDLAKDIWFVAETNYDVEDKVPSYDNRRGPLLANLNKLGRARADRDTLYGDVMLQWPVQNRHTAYTSWMNPTTSEFGFNIMIEGKDAKN